MLSLVLEKHIVRIHHLFPWRYNFRYLQIVEGDDERVKICEFLQENIPWNTRMIT